MYYVYMLSCRVWNLLTLIMYKFEHVLCADFTKSYVNCSPNGLAVRSAASVQRLYLYIHRAQMAALKDGAQKAVLRDGAQKGPLRDGAQKGSLRDGAQKGA